MKNYEGVFRAGSVTYFNSSQFFPKYIRDEVSVLYAFVRIIDDLVDSVPQQKKKFYDNWKKYREALGGKKTGVQFIDDFVALAKKRKFESDWTEAFWKSMEMDLIKPKHATLTETEEYIYGSAEVIGLFMARIMKLPKEADRTARMLGKAMQYANFIRDYQQDRDMGRNYLQVNGEKDYEAKFEVLKERFEKWQKEAEKGFKYLPKQYLVPIKTASEMYKWTIRRIAKEPMIVLREKVKPKKWRIVVEGIKIKLLG